jgi:hypothetical protein
LFGERYVERFELESRTDPASFFEALRRDAEDWHESRLIQYPWGRAFTGFSIKGDKSEFCIRLQHVWGLQCVGSIESSSLGSLLRAEIRFTNTIWVSYGVFICLGMIMIGIGVYDAFHDGGFRAAFGTMLGASILILPFVVAVALGMIWLTWRHMKPARAELHALFERVIKEGRFILSSPDSLHAPL